MKFEPFAVTIQLNTPGKALELWSALTTSNDAKRAEIQRHCGPAALLEFDAHKRRGISEGLYPDFDKLDDILVAQGVITKGGGALKGTLVRDAGRTPSDTEAGIPIFE